METGPFVLPAVFQRAGWLTGTVSLVVITCVRLIPTTIWCIQLDLSRRYFGRVLYIFVYLNTIFYLYMDLAVHAMGVAQLVYNVVCAQNDSFDAASEGEFWWSSLNLTKADVYHIIVVLTMICLLLCVIFQVVVSQQLHIIIAIFHWMTFFFTFVITLDRIITSAYVKTNSSVIQPNDFDVHNMASLFGVTVYVYSSHHHLPGILTAMANQQELKSHILILVFIFSVICNTILSGTAVYAFNNVKDLHTIAFVPYSNFNSSQFPEWFSKPVNYFITLVPVITFSSNMTTIAITLLHSLNFSIHRKNVSRRSACTGVLELCYWLIVVIPPALITLYTSNVRHLVSLAGLFATGIQGIMPVVLASRARSRLRDEYAKMKAKTLPRSQSRSQHEIYL